MAKFLQPLENIVRVPYRFFFPKKKKEDKTPAFTEPISFSYSQAGEDSIVAFLFQTILLKDFTYLDIGTNIPDVGNNTYRFYREGRRGVCIEPDVYMFHHIKRIRAEDTCLNVAIGLDNAASIDFYLFDEPSLSTLSKEEAQIRESYGNHKIKEILHIPLVKIHTIFEKYFGGKTPHFISLDVEGIDLAVLQSIDFQKYRPFCFCVETCEYSENHQKGKVQNIIDFMLTQNYFVYADTYINTIFVAKEQFDNPEKYLWQKH
jgi:FkbM family methyltransferase